MNVQPERHSVNPGIITKADAKASGLKRFFTGLPCRKGHIAERHVSSDECVVCRRAQKDRELSKHRGKNAARCKAYYANHKNEWRQYAVTNRDHINAVRRTRDRTRANETLRMWVARNRQRVNEQQRAAYWRDRDKVRAYQARYYKNNPDPFKKRALAWGKANPHKLSLWRHARRGRLRGAEGSHTSEDIADIRRLQKDRCAEPSCRCKLGSKGHIDHILALARGGSNHRRNIQLLCATCNTRKGAKDTLVIAREMGRLL